MSQAVAAAVERRRGGLLLGGRVTAAAAVVHWRDFEPVVVAVHGAADAGSLRGGQSRRPVVGLDALTLLGD